ncbi:5-oxoprolinase subunit C family protein [Jiulongibacter sediminis]|uniref:5-oxoprolinase subunit C family protein n=1 Tax=Jiulongibacter sediminis TaxID=1605367 RepID=UPI0012FE5027|nr:biotin-dependent carboxyltransferase family protein [Jiulongibacter sediminis]
MIFLKSGILTTVQDLGRFGHQAKGVNPTGAMDHISMRLINILLGNDENEAVIEFHYPTPTITFEEHAIFSIGGADFSPSLNRKPVANWKIHTAAPGDMLTFGKKQKGERAYLSVKGGFKLPKVLGSSSTNLRAGFGGLKIIKGMSLDLNLKNGTLFEASKKIALAPKTVNVALRPYIKNEQEIRIIGGAELDSLDQDSRNKIFGQRFIVSGHSDRMGYRLEGDCINRNSESEIISSSVAFGTIQLLPDGQLVILMADHQTTGGYPKIGNVISTDLPFLAQLSVGQHITFREISIDVAEKIVLKQEKEIKKFKASVKLYS